MGAAIDMAAYRAILANPALFDLVQKIAGRGRFRLKALLRRLAPPGARVLDIACGTAEFAGAFESAPYFGVDLNPRYIAYAARRRPGLYAVMDAARLAFSEASFGLVLAVNVLHHFDDATAHLFAGEAARVLAPQGRLAVVDFTTEDGIDLVRRVVIGLDRGVHVRSACGCVSIFRDLFELQELHRVPNWPWNYTAFILSPRSTL